MPGSWNRIDAFRAATARLHVCGRCFFPNTTTQYWYFGRRKLRRVGVFEDDLNPTTLALQKQLVIASRLHDLAVPQILGKVGQVSTYIEL